MKKAKSRGYHKVCYFDKNDTEVEATLEIKFEGSLKIFMCRSYNLIMWITQLLFCLGINKQDLHDPEKVTELCKRM